MVGQPTLPLTVITCCWGWLMSVILIYLFINCQSCCWGLLRNQIQISKCKSLYNTITKYLCALNIIVLYMGYQNHYKSSCEWHIQFYTLYRFSHPLRTLHIQMRIFLFIYLFIYLFFIQKNWHTQHKHSTRNVVKHHHTINLHDNQVDKPCSIAH